jgi:hypothetical protein
MYVDVVGVYLNKTAVRKSGVFRETIERGAPADC